MPSKFNLRLPPELQAAAAAVAKAQGISLNAFTVQALQNWTAYQTRRLQATGSPPVRQPAAPPPRPAPATMRSATHPEPTPPKVGRNERCPCGSGRKFKVCCGRQ